MSDFAEDLAFCANHSLLPPTESASAASDSPMKAPEETSSGSACSTSILVQKSDLLQKIKDLVQNQKELKEQKQMCNLEMKNALKHKKRLEGKVNQLSDADEVEFLHMRKVKK